MDVMGGVALEDGTECKVITGIDDHSRFCVIAKLVVRATARPVCEALLEALERHGVPGQILTDNGKVFTGRLAPRPATVAFDRLCLNTGIRHLLTAPYSPTTTGKIERLHKTMRTELFDGRRFGSIEQTQAELDAWVAHYNNEREHQAIGDVPPIRRFELVAKTSVDVIDPDAPAEDVQPPVGRTVGRRVDRAGRISILKHRYHVGRHLAGVTVAVESSGGLAACDSRRGPGRHARPPASGRRRRPDGSPSQSHTSSSTHQRRRSPAQGRPFRLGQLRRNDLPRRQPLHRPGGRRARGRRYGSDHAGRAAPTHPPSPA